MACEEFDQLVLRIDALTAEIGARRAGDLTCGRGCTPCCQVQLTLAPLEAEKVRAALAGLPEDTRARIRARGVARLSEPAPARDAACVMLEEDGACAIYAARPLVCRTQGHALRYPAGTLPGDSVFATGAGGEITWCPLNYTGAPPRSEDVLEAARIDETSARIHALETEGSSRALERTAMVDLALE